jgi:hypothetical protein
LRSDYPGMIKAPASGSGRVLTERLGRAHAQGFRAAAAALHDRKPLWVGDGAPGRFAITSRDSVIAVEDSIVLARLQRVSQPSGGLFSAIPRSNRARGAAFCHRLFHGAWRPSYGDTTSLDCRNPQATSDGSRFSSVSGAPRERIRSSPQSATGCQADVCGRAGAGRLVRQDDRPMTLAQILSVTVFRINSLRATGRICWAMKGYTLLLHFPWSCRLSTKVHSRASIEVCDRRSGF